MREAIAARLQRSTRVYDVVLDEGDGRRLAWLHQHGEVIDRSSDDAGHTLVKVRLADDVKARFDAPAR